MLDSPGRNAKPFDELIVTVPLLQTLTMAIGLLTIALEWPLPLVSEHVLFRREADRLIWQIEGTALHRSLSFRVVVYFLAGFMGIMIYQVRSARLVGEGRS